MGSFKDRGWFAVMFVLEKGGFKDKLDREQGRASFGLRQTVLKQQWRALLPAT